MNEIGVVVRGKNDFASTAQEVVQDNKRIAASITDVGATANAEMADVQMAFDTAARSTGKFGEGLDQAAGFSGNVADGLDGVATAANAFGDAMDYSEKKADELTQIELDLEQATQDVQQAMEDMDQSIRDATQAELDSEQAAIDLEQAKLDQAEAQRELNAAIKEFGPNSKEAKQAQLDLQQAGLDVKQASEDAAQATEDLEQAHLDASQAAIDQADADLRLSQSQRELERQSGTLQKVGDFAGILSGVLGGLVGIIGVVTAVQWAWNAALIANPIGLIIAGIVALIAIIVIIAMKTTWFQDIWKVVWGGIKSIAGSAWNYIKAVANSGMKLLTSIPGKIKNAFSRVGSFISAPFRAGFNAVSRFWNGTIGRLHWSVPNWVPGIGGNAISAPQLPFLQGGGKIVRDGVAYVHAGETVQPAGVTALGGSGGGLVIEVVPRPGGNRELLDALIEGVQFKVRTEGRGNANDYLSGQ